MAGQQHVGGPAPAAGSPTATATPLTPLQTRLYFFVVVLFYAAAFGCSLPVVPYMARSAAEADTAELVAAASGGGGAGPPGTAADSSPGPGPPVFFLGELGAWLNLERTETITSILMSAYSLGKVPATWAVSSFSDRFASGAQKCLAASLLGTAAVTLYVGFQTSVRGIFLSRVLLGFFGGNGALMQAWISSDVPANQRFQVFMDQGLAWSFASLFGRQIVHHFDEDPRVCLAFAALFFVLAAAATALPVLLRMGTAPHARTPGTGTPGTGAPVPCGTATRERAVERAEARRDYSPTQACYSPAARAGADADAKKAGRRPGADAASDSVPGGRGPSSAWDDTPLMLVYAIQLVMPRLVFHHILKAHEQSSPGTMASPHAHTDRVWRGLRLAPLPHRAPPPSPVSIGVPRARRLVGCERVRSHPSFTAVAACRVESNHGHRPTCLGSSPSAAACSC